MSLYLSDTRYCTMLSSVCFIKRFKMVLFSICVGSSDGRCSCSFAPFAEALIHTVGLKMRLKTYFALKAEDGISRDSSGSRVLNS